MGDGARAGSLGDKQAGGAVSAPGAALNAEIPLLSARGRGKAGSGGGSRGWCPQGGRAPSWGGGRTGVVVGSWCSGICRTGTPAVSKGNPGKSPSHPAVDAPRRGWCRASHARKTCNRARVHLHTPPRTDTMPLLHSVDSINQCLHCNSLSSFFTICV